MENSQLEELQGQVQALATVLNAVVSTLPRLPAAQVAMALAIEEQTIRQMDNRSQGDETELAIITAYRDLAQSIG